MRSGLLWFWMWFWKRQVKAILQTEYVEYVVRCSQLPLGAFMHLPRYSLIFPKPDLLWIVGKDHNARIGAVWVAKSRLPQSHPSFSPVTYISSPCHQGSFFKQRGREGKWLKSIISVYHYTNVFQDLWIFSFLSPFPLKSVSGPFHCRDTRIKRTCWRRTPSRPAWRRGQCGREALLRTLHGGATSHTAWRLKQVQEGDTAQSPHLWWLVSPGDHPPQHGLQEKKAIMGACLTGLHNPPLAGEDHRHHNLSMEWLFSPEDHCHSMQL